MAEYAYLVGYDDDDEVGRRRRRGGGGRRGQRRRDERRNPAPRLAPPPQAVEVRKLPPPRRQAFEAAADRFQVMPLGNVAVPGLGSAQLVARVQREIQGNRITLIAIDTLSGLSTEAILIDDIKVGTVSQLAGNTSLPLSTFSQVATGIMMEMTPAPAGIDVTVYLTNLSPNIVSVSGAIVGKTRGNT